MLKCARLLVTIYTQKVSKYQQREPQVCDFDFNLFVWSNNQFQLQNAIKQFDVAKVNLKQNEDEAKKQVEIEAIADEMYIARGKQISDSLKYRIEKEAESNRIKLTRKYLDYTKVQAFSNNLVVVHGDKIPTYIVSP